MFLAVNVVNAVKKNIYRYKPQILQKFNAYVLHKV